MHRKAQTTEPIGSRELLQPIGDLRIRRVCDTERIVDRRINPRLHGAAQTDLCGDR